MRLEDLAIVGDTQTAALVGRDGAVHWMCLPRFDSNACFASLLGRAEHGLWRIAPAGEVLAVHRRYRDDTLVLETEFHTPSGVARVVDAMPVRGEAPDLIRLVEGVSGTVDVRAELVLRFDYGRAVPWVRRLDGRVHAIAGPDAVVVASPALAKGTDLERRALTIRAGDRVPFVLTWYPSHERAPDSPDGFAGIEDTDAFWRRWASRCSTGGPYRDAVARSMLTVKALTYAPTGAIVAAATTSLPEALGGERNWDYRFCWLRDAAFSLYAMLHAGYEEEAAAWRDWLLRAVAGDPPHLQTMYGLFGERWVGERCLRWLPGYERSCPVRAGTDVADQRQIDIYGEVIDALHQARRLGVRGAVDTWPIERAIAEWLESAWREPGHGIWEVRADERHFTHSKMMAWVGLDRAIKAIEKHGADGPLERLRRARADVHAEVCKRGYDAELGSFTQAYGDRTLDAALLLMPSVGFLPAEDPRVRGTIAAIERDLVEDGFVKRYPTHAGRDNVDGLPGREGAFLACSFWLADAYVLSGREDDARRVFERVLGVRNDLGLLSEEYDVRAKRLVGNFPQAFSHVSLVNCAHNLTTRHGPARHRQAT